MNVTLCTLFEGDYHLGAAALLNSLHRAGFAGTFVCGHRGPRPPWAADTVQLEPIRVCWVEVTVPIHLTNHKPIFMLAALEEHAPAADAVGYLDPDVVVKAPWSVMERWIGGGGLALCEDVNASLPRGHPQRLAWHEFFQRHHLPVRRELDRYYNGGFVAVPASHAAFLVRWAEIIALGRDETGTLAQLKHAGPHALFHSADQDALNMTLMLTSVPIHATGPEGMDFLPGGHFLSHAAGGAKPWRGGFLQDALSGRPPGLAQKAFYRHATSPLPVLSAGTLAWRRGDLALAALLGRFYRRS